MTDRPREYSPQGWEIHKQHLRQHLEAAKAFVDPDNLGPVSKGLPMETQTIVKCYNDMQTLEYVVPPGTEVIVEKAEKAGGNRRPHTTKQENRFPSNARRYGEYTDDYMQFATGDPKWVYMFVLKSLFDRDIAEEVTKAVTADLKELLKTPANEKEKTKVPLTEKQQKRMQKKSKCPDCGNDSWLGGPCGGGSQNIQCKDCGSKFNMMGPFGIDRI